MHRGNIGQLVRSKICKSVDTVLVGFMQVLRLGRQPAWFDDAEGDKDELPQAAQVMALPFLPFLQLALIRSQKARGLVVLLCRQGSLPNQWVIDLGRAGLGDRLARLTQARRQADGDEKAVLPTQVWGVVDMATDSFEDRSGI